MVELSCEVPSPSSSSFPVAVRLVRWWVLGFRSGWRTRNLKGDPRWLVRAPKLTMIPSSLQRNLLPTCCRKATTKYSSELQENELPLETANLRTHWVLEISQVHAWDWPSFPLPNFFTHTHTHLVTNLQISTNRFYTHQVLSERRRCWWGLV